MLEDAAASAMPVTARAPAVARARTTASRLRIGVHRFV
jgi:hypothetical protein